MPFLNHVFYKNNFFSTVVWLLLLNNYLLLFTILITINSSSNYGKTLQLYKQDVCTVFQSLSMYSSWKLKVFLFSWGGYDGCLQFWTFHFNNKLSGPALKGSLCSKGCSDKLPQITLTIYNCAYGWESNILRSCNADYFWHWVFPAELTDTNNNLCNYPYL